MSKFDPLTHEIPEADVPMLRSLLGLADDYGTGDANDLSPELRIAYWERKKVHDRIGMGALSVDAFEAIGVAAGLGRTLPADEKSPSILVLADEGRISNGDPVTFMWRRQQVPGHFQGITRDRKLAKVTEVDNSEIRTVPVNEVWADPDREPAELTPASAKKAEKAAKQADDDKPKNKGGRPRKHPLPEPVGAAAGGSERKDIHAGQAQSDDDV